MKFPNFSIVLQMVTSGFGVDINIVNVNVNIVNVNVNIVNVNVNIGDA